MWARGRASKSRMNTASFRFALIAFAVVSTFACSANVADEPAGTCPAKAPTKSVGCRCGSGSVCVVKPQAGGIGYIDCVPIPTSCGGVATCGCMGCLCGDLGLKCTKVEEDHSTGSGNDLFCE